MASACMSVGACRKPPDIQMLPDGVRLERSQPSPARSPIFDGKVVQLRGARGETLGVQLRISDGLPRSARLELPASAADVSAFSVRSLEVREPSTSLYGPSSGRGVYPDVLVPASGAVRTSDLVYFDIAIPSSARPGRYEGKLAIDERRIPALLDVSRARIDLRREPLVWVFYLPREIARAHGLSDVDGPELIEAESAYHELFRAHGAFLAADLPPSRFEARRRFMHDVAYWPVAIDTTSDVTIESDVRSWLDLFRGTGITPFAIPVDEPRTVEDKERARHIAQVIGRAGGGRPRLLRAVTDAPLPIYGDEMDVFVSPKSIPFGQQERRGRGERFWTYNGRPPEAGSMILDTDGAALRTWGWIAERYGVSLWYAWEGLYFSDRYNHGGPTDVMHAPITFDERRKGGSDWGTGAGVLAYPGPLPSLRLKALRRGLEDRLLLRELEACGGGDTARRIVRRVVPRALGEAGSTPAWPRSATDWELARSETLDAIEVQCHDDEQLAR